MEQLLAASTPMTYENGLKQGRADKARGIDFSRSYRNNPGFIEGYRQAQEEKVQ